MGFSVGVYVRFGLLLVRLYVLVLCVRVGLSVRCTVCGLCVRVMCYRMCEERVPCYC